MEGDSFQFSIGPPNSGFSMFMADRTKKVHFIRWAEIKSVARIENFEWWLIRLCISYFDCSQQLSHMTTFCTLWVDMLKVFTIKHRERRDQMTALVTWSCGMQDSLRCGISSYDCVFLCLTSKDSNQKVATLLQLSCNSTQISHFWRVKSVEIWIIIQHFIVNVEWNWAMQATKTRACCASFSRKEFHSFWFDSRISFDKVCRGNLCFFTFIE